MFCDAAKTERRGDTLTHNHVSSIERRQSRFCPSRSSQQYGEKAVLMTVISSSERSQSGLRSFADLISLGRSKCASPDHDFPTVIAEFCLHVKVSPCCTLFVASPNLATSQPGHGVFACLLMAPEGLGSESQWEWCARGFGFPHENFSQFHPCLPPQRVPSPDGFLLSILAPKWAAMTLTLCTQHCVPGSHLHVPHQNSTSTHFQYRIGGAVMLDAVTYGQDCISIMRKNSPFLSLFSVFNREGITLQITGNSHNRKSPPSLLCCTAWYLCGTIVTDGSTYRRQTLQKRSHVKRSG